MVDIDKALKTLGQFETLSLRGISAPVIARLLLLIIKKLPHPLLTLELHDRWRSVAKLEAYDDETKTAEATRLQYIAYFLRMLPRPNYDTFREVLRALSISWSTGIMANRRGLLQAWAPALFLRDGVHDTSIDITWTTQLLQVMIENHASLFPGAGVAELPMPVLAKPQPPNAEDAGPVVALPPLHVKRKVEKSFKHGKIGSLSSEKTASASLVTPRTTNTDGGRHKPHQDQFVQRDRSWLSAVNAARVFRLDAYHSKMEALLDDVREWAGKPKLTMSGNAMALTPTSPRSSDSKAGEFLPCLEFCTSLLACMVKSLDAANPETLPKLIDTYHMDRCHTFVVDLHSIVKHEIDRNKLERFFTTNKLHGTLQRLYLSMEQELYLAFSTIDTLLNGTITRDPIYQIQFKNLTDGWFIKHALPGTEWWRTHFGLYSFTAPWGLFVQRLLDISKNIPAAIVKAVDDDILAKDRSAADRKDILRSILDPSSTGRVSIYKFAKFLDGFGCLEVAARHCEHVAGRPWFHNYVSDEETGRFLEVFPAGSFIVHFPHVDPNLFKIWYKAGGNQFKSIQVNPRHTVDTTGQWCAEYFIEKDGDGNEVKKSYKSLDEVVEANKYDLYSEEPLLKMHSRPWFYGEFGAAECHAYLQSEEPGTFLVRYSSTDPECLTLSFVSGSRQVRHYRLGREEDGQVSFQPDESRAAAFFETIDQFVLAADQLTIPYNHDNHVSATQEEESARETGVSFASILADPEILTVSTLLNQYATTPDVPNDAATQQIISKKSSHSVTSSAPPPQLTHEDRIMNTQVIITNAAPIHTRKDHGRLLSSVSQMLMVTSLSDADSPNTASNRLGYIGPEMRSSNPTAESRLEVLLQKITFRAPISYRDLSYLYAAAFSVKAKTYASAQKKPCKEIGKGKARILPEPAIVSLTSMPLHELKKCSFTIKNGFKSKLYVTVDAPPAITHAAYIAVSPQAPCLEPGESLEIVVSVVLFKPCTIHEIIFLHFDGNRPADQAATQFGMIGSAALASSSDIPSHTVAVPLSVSVHKNYVWIEPFSHWSIPQNYFTGIEATKPLGRGQAAAVYAWDLLGVNVAVKRWDIGKRDPSPEDLKQELSLMTGLQHRNLIRLVGACHGMIVMELMQGSLDSVLKVRRPTDDEVMQIETEALSETDKGTDGVSSAPSPRGSTALSRPPIITPDAFQLRLTIAHSIARALLCLHDNSLLHRDVKSLNVLIQKGTNSARLADFGEVDHQEAGKNDAAGSLPWMAPEVYQGQYYAYKADVFSFGCFLYELIMGVNPQRTPRMVEAGVMPTIPFEYATTADSRIRKFILLLLCCTRRAPEKRPTMFAVVRDLEKILSSSRTDNLRTDLRR